MPDAAFWAGRHVLVTGHTGFKGAWLSLWLQSLGARVHGLALAPPTRPSLFEAAQVAQGMDSRLGDIRDYDTVQDAVRCAQPEIVLHLAAQALVGESYRTPLETYATNVMGTAHVLEACRHAGSVRAIVCVTSDKCYENREWLWGYREGEALGGHDPYSSSKACAELVSAAYRQSWLHADGIAVATARAGNVIGGGDWADGRLVPDALRAFGQGQVLQLRNPSAVRPWQHVLEPLAGYLVLAQQLCRQGPDHAEAWNFGPAEHDARPVQWIVDRLAALWGEGARWTADPAAHHPHEAHWLKLDAAKARARLDWQPHWDLQEALVRTVAWHRAWQQADDLRALSLQQIQDHSAAGFEAP